MFGTKAEEAQRCRRQSFLEKQDFTQAKNTSFFATVRLCADFRPFGRRVPQGDRMQILPNHLDREAKKRIARFADALSPKLTGKNREVLDALLRLVGDVIAPEDIAVRAACSRPSVYQALRVLEAAGILTTSRTGRALSTVTLIVPDGEG
jgi:hypothetical protein